MSRAVISVRTSASPAVNWSDMTWSPCFAACRTASVMASAWAGVNSASVSARATACVSQHAPQLSPKTPPPKGGNCDADDELTGRVPVAAGHGRRRRRRRGDGCRSRATWASGRAGHPERRCLSPRPWRPNEPSVDAAVSGVSRAGAGKSDGQARGRGRPRCRRRSGTARAATTCRPTAWDSRARRPASRRGSRARRDRRSRRYAERRVGGHGPDCGGSP